MANPAHGPIIAFPDETFGLARIFHPVASTYLKALTS
jgi:hypothetical protein